MSECKCDFRGKLLGDGCDICNPAKALKYALETIANQTAELDTLRAQLAAAEARAERLVAAVDTVLLRFTDTESAGYRTADRQFAIDILSKALAEGDGR